MTNTTIRASFPIRRGERRTRQQSEPSTTPPPESASVQRPVSRAARMLALAHHVERLIESRELSGYTEAARPLGLTRARLTQVMNLLLLAPNVQEQLLTGELAATERSLRAVVAEPCWAAQSAASSPGHRETR